VRLILRWFPLMLALFQATRHAGLIAYDYWRAARPETRFDVRAYVREDLSRPLLEPSGWCDAWVHHSMGQNIDLGWDLPAYMAASVLHGVLSRHTPCVDTFTRPRGQVIVAPFVPLLWFLAGLSLRRLARRQWRRAKGKLGHTVAWIGLFALPFGIVALLLGIVGLLTIDASTTLRLVGLGWWMTFVGALSAERLSVWPFDERQCTLRERSSST
jgi:hypothetical protein